MKKDDGCIFCRANVHILSSDNFFLSEFLYLMIRNLTEGHT